MSTDRRDGQGLMDFKQALTILRHEHEADDGLLVLFRLSDDVTEERLERFVEVLNVLETHYDGTDVVGKDVAYMVMSFYQTLSASAGHWKVSRPKGLTLKMTMKILIALSGVFAS